MKLHSISELVHSFFSSLFCHMRNIKSSDTSQPNNEESPLLMSTSLSTKLKKRIELGFLQESTNEEITLTYIH